MNELSILISIVPKIIVATVCGFIIGYERELKNKVAGIRTHILVCVGVCIFTIISFLLGKQFNVDPTRIIGQIVTGIGFLGAGVIFKQDDKIVGVTSASFIWLISAIGVMIGIGYIWIGLILTLGLLGITSLLTLLENHISHK